MYLKDLIAKLEEHDPNQKVPIGFGKPHSYRGYYEDLGFEIVYNTTVGHMLAAATGALRHEFTGWKGGEFTMTEYTTVWLAKWGYTGEGLGLVLLNFMLGLETGEEV